MSDAHLKDVLSNTETLYKGVKHNRYRMSSWNKLLSYVEANLPIEYAREYYEKYLKYFPTAGKVWANYIKNELDNKDIDRAAEILSRCLPTYPHVSIHSAYIEYVRAKLAADGADNYIPPKGSDMIAMKTKTLQFTPMYPPLLVTLLKAYHYTLSIVGTHLHSYDIWDAYIKLLKLRVSDNDSDANIVLDGVNIAYSAAVRTPFARVGTISFNCGQWENDMKKASIKVSQPQNHPEAQRASNIADLRKKKLAFVEWASVHQAGRILARFNGNKYNSLYSKNAQDTYYYPLCPPYPETSNGNIGSFNIGIKADGQIGPANDIVQDTFQNYMQWATVTDDIASGIIPGILPPEVITLMACEQKLLLMPDNISVWETLISQDYSQVSKLSANKPLIGYNLELKLTSQEAPREEMNENNEAMDADTEKGPSVPSLRLPPVIHILGTKDLPNKVLKGTPISYLTSLAPLNNALAQRFRKAHPECLLSHSRCVLVANENEDHVNEALAYALNCPSLPSFSSVLLTITTLVHSNTIGKEHTKKHVSLSTFREDDLCLACLPDSLGIYESYRRGLIGHDLANTLAQTTLPKFIPVTGRTDHSQSPIYVRKGVTLEDNTMTIHINDFEKIERAVEVLEGGNLEMPSEGKIRVYLMNEEDFSAELVTRSYSAFPLDGCLPRVFVVVRSQEGKMRTNKLTGSPVQGFTMSTYLPSDLCIHPLIHVTMLKIALLEYSNSNANKVVDMLSPRDYMNNLFMIVLRIMQRYHGTNRLYMGHVTRLITMYYKRVSEDEQETKAEVMEELSDEHDTKKRRSHDNYTKLADYAHKMRMIVNLTSNRNLFVSHHLLSKLFYIPSYEYGYGNNEQNAQPFDSVLYDYKLTPSPITMAAQNQMFMQGLATAEISMAHETYTQENEGAKAMFLDESLETLLSVRRISPLLSNIIQHTEFGVPPVSNTQIEIEYYSQRYAKLSVLPSFISKSQRSGQSPIQGSEITDFMEMSNAAKLAKAYPFDHTKAVKINLNTLQLIVPKAVEQEFKSKQKRVPLDKLGLMSIPRDFITNVACSIKQAPKQRGVPAVLVYLLGLLQIPDLTNMSYYNVEEEVNRLAHTTLKKHFQYNSDSYLKLINPVILPPDESWRNLITCTADKVSDMRYEQSGKKIPVIQTKNKVF